MLSNSSKSFFAAVALNVLLSWPACALILVFSGGIYMYVGFFLVVVSEAFGLSSLPFEPVQVGKVDASSSFGSFFLLWVPSFLVWASSFLMPVICRSVYEPCLLVSVICQLVFVCCFLVCAIWLLVCLSFLLVCRI